MKSPKPQFSISMLMLAIAVVALFPSFYFYKSKASSLAAENDRMSAELGLFDVIDPDRVYIRELGCPIELTWQFRIHMPTDKFFISSGLCGDTDPTKQDVTPVATSRIICPSDFVLTVRLFEDEQGRIRYRANYVSASSSELIDETFPLNISLTKRASAIDHNATVANRFHRNGTPHGDVRAFAPTEFIALFVLESDDPDQYVVFYLEPKQPVLSRKR